MAGTAFDIKDHKKCCHAKDCGDIIKCLPDSTWKQLWDEFKKENRNALDPSQALCGVGDSQAFLADWDFCILPIMFINTNGPAPADILRTSETTILSVVVGITGPGAAALVALGLPIKACFFAESIGTGPEYNFGCTTINTYENEFWYSLSLTVPPNTMAAEYVYELSATITLGAMPPNPSLGNGFVSDVHIEVYP